MTRLDHVAIMKKSWGLTEKILSGDKTIESRWYSSRVSPWGRIKAGDVVYFKNSGEKVRIASDVQKVLQFSDLTPHRVQSILDEYGRRDGISKVDIQKFFRLFMGKRYCILVFLKNARRVEPFDIDKKGFGSMSAWVSVESVESIRK